jgi:hypothetical protein
VFDLPGLPIEHRLYTPFLKGSISRRINLYFWRVTRLCQILSTVLTVFNLNISYSESVDVPSPVFKRCIHKRQYFINSYPQSTSLQIPHPNSTPSHSPHFPVSPSPSFNTQFPPTINVPNTTGTPINQVAVLRA